MVSALVLLPESVFARQTPLNAPASMVGAGQAATASRVTERPTIDGDVLGDPVWQQATPMSDFTQEQPNQGQPSTERTEVRVVYTADTLYVGVVLYDRDPSGIIVSDSRRDTSLDDSDSFRMIFDTYRDRQNGFVFGTNPAGIEYDGQVTNEGQGGGGLGAGQTQQSGSGSGFNLNWDGAWEVRAAITDIGWSAEFAIPFRTLRYPSGTDQEWGVNFQRNIRRRNERAYWAPIPPQFNIYRLSLAGTISGIQTPVIRNFKVTPYVLGNIRTSGVKPVDSVTLGDVGGDVKYNVTPSLTLDGTINTDFAQVEVDDQQVNLDRFNLFFPEKRPFFLENAGFFTVGNPGEIDLFFSRRIGISPSGEGIPIVAGGRLSGKAGRFNLGVLDMQTEAFGTTPGTNFGVLRVSRDLPNRSSIGALFVNRQGVGDRAVDDDHNRTYAVDGKWGVGQATMLSSFVAKTDTPGVDGDDYAFNVRSRTNLPRVTSSSGIRKSPTSSIPRSGF